MKQVFTSGLRLSLCLALSAAGAACGWVDDSGRQGNKSPIADVENLTTFEETLGNIIDASASSDPDGAIESYTWTLVSGDETALAQFSPMLGFPSISPTFTFSTPTLREPKALQFNLTVTDNDGGTAQKIVDVLINSINEPPTVAPDSYLAEEGEVRSVTPPVFDDAGNQTSGEATLLSNDEDDDDVSNMPLVASLKSGFGPRLGTVTIFPDGGFNYVHDGTEPTGANASDSFVYIASDGTHDVESIVSIVIIESNDPPVGVIDSYALNEDEALQVSPEDGVLSNDFDIDIRPGEIITAILAEAPEHGTLSFLNDGSFTYQHNGTSQSTIDTFSYFPRDDLELPDVATIVTLEIAQFDDAPVAFADSYPVNAGELLEGGDLTIGIENGVLLNDTDDENQTLSAILVSNPSHGQITLNPDGSFVYSHDGGESVSDSFTYSAFDGTSQSPPATVELTITPVNDPPIARNDSYTVDEGRTSSFNERRGVLSNDEDPENDALSISRIVEQPEHGVLDLDDDGSFTYDHDGSETPREDSFRYEAKDSNDAVSNIATVTLTIRPRNDPPEFTSAPPTGPLTEDEPFSYAISASDPDLNDTLTLSVLPNAVGLVVSDNGDGTGTLQGTPTNSAVGINQITLRVQDSEGATDTQTFNITVLNTNDEPSLSGFPDTSVQEGDTYSFTPTLSDPDVGDTHTFSITNEPSWANFNTSTGQLSGTP
ncbi:MAG: Ig-like domain-containing protein, partial [Pseudomonadota bacterium]